MFLEKTKICMSDVANSLVNAQEIRKIWQFLIETSHTMAGTFCIFYGICFLTLDPFELI